jgi:glyoxylase-like metal-dependent hydrolase (beta-lactamase superfamily II)
MPRRAEDITPHPPATSEFGVVERGGAPHRYPPAGGVDVVKLCVGEWENDVYVVSSDGQAIVVDGAAEPDRILAEVEGLTVTGIVQTHGHGDHVQALPELVRRLDVPVLAHPDDRMPVPARPLRDGERLQVGRAEVEVLHTPGHTPGSLCFRVDRFLFTGDTLFPGGPGNTGGDQEAFGTIMRSLDVLFGLGDEMRVCPGHGLDTTIGRERPYVETWRARGW